MHLVRALAAAFCALQYASAAPTDPDCAPNPILDPTGDKLGAVASENSQCSKIGIDMLRQGGNAADAMVATVFCVGTIGMYHSGIGGGGFMVVRAANGSYEHIDFRETAPASYFQDMYNSNVNLSLYGGLASGVPGELRGLERLNKGYGVLPWATLMAPSINLARNGFIVSKDLVDYMASATAGLPNFLVEDPSFAIDFAPNGTLVQLGQTIYRKRYADTLETISQYGADAFYTGAIANATITALKATGGTMELSDLKNYSAAIQTPVQISYRDYVLTSCGAPASGAVMLAIIKEVETYQNFGQASAINASTERLNQAMRFAYGERPSLGDPFFNSSTLPFQAAMLAPSTIANVDSRITNVTHPVSYYQPEISNGTLETVPQDHGTSEVVTSDASGLTISLTTTINTLFGSLVMVPETGVIMNNEMNDFSIPSQSNTFGYAPSAANYIVPGKRPLSSISPVIVEHASNHSVYLATGAAGGSRIITAVAQILWHVLDQNMSISQALAQPRLHDQLIPNQVSFEYAYDNATVAFLAAGGSNVTYIAPGQSTAQGLRLLGNGSFEAAGDPRQDDSAGLVI